ncbi:hypothetical protein P8935_05210 [Telmatobacter sp. DSM 110680]|uniref:WD40-like Beta Propeller Repeat n=1 Tax=Telmatobacter sp. DSM 110680 TaxID=3036704 RepID=A0AAU7DN21_9BACT
MGSQQPTNGRLDGWKAISDYLGWHVRTVMRWEEQKGLPVHRVPGGQRHAVYAYKNEIDGWLKLGEGLLTATQPEESAIRGDSPEVSESSLPRHLDGIVAPKISSAVRPQNASWIARHGKQFVLASGVAILVSICGFTLHSLGFSKHFRIINVTQITDDGAMKRGLVTDGTTLYFGEYRDGKVGLLSIPVAGGPVREIRTPFTMVFPTDISADGKKLLILAGQGTEVERSLWILRLLDGDLNQVGTAAYHSASWSPDGNAIALASQNAVYLTTDQGKTIRSLQTFDGIPEAVQWSKDGSRLRIELRDPKTMTFAFWELAFDRPSNYDISSLTPLKADLTETFDGSMSIDESGRSFVVGGEGILAFAADRFPLHRFTLLDLKVPLRGVNDVTLDWRVKRLFATASSTVEQSTHKPHAEFLLFDQSSQGYRPFLPGGGGEFIDFSRDGQWITYKSTTEKALYISRADGSETRMMNVPAGEIELPRWSPDGKRIAFMESLPNKPFRIFVISANGGTPKEAGVGADSQGAPTWSPDGRMLAYGSVECQETKTCAIHKIDLATGLESTVPDSEGLGTARWSPDGRFIAALDPVRHLVMLFSEQRHRWREIANGVNGNDLSWSADSRYLFANRPTGDQPQIIRISIRDGKIDTAVDLSKLSKLQGRFDSWFAIGPDNAIILSREMSSNEIYSISYED